MVGGPYRGGYGGTAGGGRVRGLLASLGASSLIALAVVAAQAQQIPQPPSVPAAGQADPRPLQLRGFLRVEGEYTDNFFLSEKNKQEEFREIVTPGLGLRLESGRSFADVSYAPSLIHSSINEGEIEVFHLLDGSGSLALTERTTLNATERFLRTDVPALTDPQGIRRDRTILIQNTFTSGLTYRQDTWTLTPRYSVTLNRNEGGQQNQVGNQGQPVTNEKSLIQTFSADGALDIVGRNTLGAGYDFTVGEFKVADDFIGHTGRVSFSRQLNPLTTAGLGGSVAHRDVQRGTDFNIYSGDIRLRRDVSPLYAVEGRFGYNITDDAAGGGAEGFTFLLQGNYTGKSFRTSGTSSQSIQETFLDRNNVGLIESRDSTLQISYEATPDLTLTLRGRMAQNSFLQSSGSTLPAGQQDRKDVLMDGGVDIAFRLTRLLSLTIGYNYTSADSNLRGFGYQSNRVRIGLTATYP